MRKDPIAKLVYLYKAINMSNISKALLLLALFVGLCGAFSSCSSSKIPGMKPDDPLQATLSVLETTAARLEKTAVPTEGGSSVPDTGNGDGAQPTDAPSTLPVEEPPAEAAPSLEPGSTSDTGPFIPQPSPTIACERDDSRMALSASKTKLKVGETVAVKVTLKNTGCVSLGLPQYRMAILNSEGKPIFSPDKPEPVVHSLAVIPGGADEATFVFQAVSQGKATLSAMASFEVHLGYPGPAYWGANSSEALVIEVEK